MTLLTLHNFSKFQLACHAMGKIILTHEIIRSISEKVRKIICQHCDFVFRPLLLHKRESPQRVHCNHNSVGGTRHPHSFRCQPTHLQATIAYRNAHAATSHAEDSGRNCGPRKLQVLFAEESCMVEVLPFLIAHLERHCDLQEDLSSSLSTWANHHTQLYHIQQIVLLAPEPTIFSNSQVCTSRPCI